MNKKIALKMESLNLIKSEENVEKKFLFLLKLRQYFQNSEIIKYFEQLHHCPVIYKIYKRPFKTTETITRLY